jgi:hypothetical protein
MLEEFFGKAMRSMECEGPNQIGKCEFEKDIRFKKANKTRKPKQIMTFLRLRKCSTPRTPDKT